MSVAFVYHGKNKLFFVVTDLHLLRTWLFSHPELALYLSDFHCMTFFCETREDRGRNFWMCETGMGQQVAQLRDSYIIIIIIIIIIIMMDVKLGR